MQAPHRCPLPPASAVRLAWARTSQFSKPPSESPKDEAEDPKKVKEARILVDPFLKPGWEDLWAVKGGTGGTRKLATSPEELRYLLNALAAVDSTVRTLETIYRGRELNFQEQETLMDAYLEYVKVAQGKGQGLSEDLRSLLHAVPALVIGSASGLSIALVAQANLLQTGLIVVASTIALFALSLGWSWASSAWKLQSFVRTDYQRNVYFDLYVNTVQDALKGLYNDVEQLHKEAFGGPCPDASGFNAVPRLLEPLKSNPGSCQYVIRHMAMGLVTAERWPLCESGSAEMVNLCPYWAVEKRQDPQWWFRVAYWAHRGVHWVPDLEAGEIIIHSFPGRLGARRRTWVVTDRRLLAETRRHRWRRARCIKSYHLPAIQDVTLEMQAGPEAVLLRAREDNSVRAEAFHIGVESPDAFRQCLLEQIGRSTKPPADAPRRPSPGS